MSDERDRVAFQGILPYVHYADAAKMSAWLVRVFGFRERRRFDEPDGSVRNIEMLAGAAEIWLDGDPAWFAEHGARQPTWIGVWVDDVDAMHARVKAAGVAAEPPEDKPYGVRVFQVRDPEGCEWGFLRRID